MTAVPGATSVIARHFHDHAAEVEAVFWQAGTRAYERSMDAKEGSELVTNEAFGASYWLNLPLLLEPNLLKVLPGAETVRFERVRYPVVRWEGMYILPAKLLERTRRRPDELRVRRSAFREELTHLNPAPAPDPNLFDLLASAEGPGALAPNLAPTTLTSPSATSTLVVAFECSPSSGFTAVHLGLGESDAGSIILRTPQTLLRHQPLVVTQSPAATVVTSAHAAAPAPRPALQLVDDTAGYPGPSLALRNNDELEKPQNGE